MTQRLLRLDPSQWKYLSPLPIMTNVTSESLDPEISLHFLPE
jgi:hypothetical protein